jgi:hypothetical protein
LPIVSAGDRQAIAGIELPADTAVAQLVGDPFAVAYLLQEKAIVLPA